MQCACVAGASFRPVTSQTTLLWGYALEPCYPSSPMHPTGYLPLILTDLAIHAAPEVVLASVWWPKCLIR